MPVERPPVTRSTRSEPVAPRRDPTAAEQPAVRHHAGDRSTERRAALGAWQRLMASPPRAELPNGVRDDLPDEQFLGVPDVPGVPAARWAQSDRLDEAWPTALEEALPWPELMPEPEIRSDTDEAAAFAREMTRLQRLDAEQRGDPWNG